MDRLEERQALDQVLDAARRGLSAALVVRGEPGVGKTSLLGYAVDSAAGFRVVHVAGVESELELGFAGLHRLLVSFPSTLAGLPLRQGEALGRARGHPCAMGRCEVSEVLLSDLSRHWPGCPGHCWSRGPAGTPDASSVAAPALLLRVRLWS
jgi:hypothetical protein